MKLTEIMKIRWNRNTTSRRSNISLDTCNTTHKSHCRQASVHDAALYLYPDKNQVVPIQKQKWTSRVSRRRYAKRHVCSAVMVGWSRLPAVNSRHEEYSLLNVCCPSSPHPLSSLCAHFASCVELRTDNSRRRQYFVQRVTLALLTWQLALFSLINFAGEKHT